MAFQFEWWSQQDGASLWHDEGVTVTTDKGFTKRVTYNYMDEVKATIKDDLIDGIMAKRGKNLADVPNLDLDGDDLPIAADILLLIGYLNVRQHATMCDSGI